LNVCGDRLAARWKSRALSTRPYVICWLNSRSVASRP
jgi:hypothetical protein